MPGLLQDLFMDVNISPALLALVVAGCVRWLRLILILPWGLVLSSAASAPGMGCGLRSAASTTN